MGLVRTTLTAAGLLIIAVGLAWVAHGMGTIHLPASDFITKQSVWTTNGTLVAVFGLIVLWSSRRFLR